MKEFLAENPEVYRLGTSSIFDPVLAEIAYKWFSPKGGVVLDPFAGGSVRGIVAAICNRRYVGIDLRKEQIDENRNQAAKIIPDIDLQPVWSVGDSNEIQKLCQGVEADFIFSCPPYADLEVYSDDPRDISNMSYEDFLESYRNIIARSTEMLRENRFACFVISEIRDKKGNYRGFVPDTIRAFEDAGLTFYDDIILKNVIASAAIRAGSCFETSRKIVRIHQNVLVFVKGDPKKATESCGAVDVLLSEE